MPNIKLTDQLGFTVDAEINPDSTIAKYINSQVCELLDAMSSQAQPSFGSLTPFRKLSGTGLAEITGDFTVIKWWAKPMKEMSESLAEVRKFIDSNPGIDPRNKKFTALRTSWRRT